MEELRHDWQAATDETRCDFSFTVFFKKGGFSLVGERKGGA